MVGGSDDIQKPGGKVLKNLIDGHFKGSLYVVNPKMDEVQGIKSYRDVKDLPEVDCAILAIAAKFCPSTVEMLAKQKNTRAFIILSAGFSEENAEGKALEKQIPKKITNMKSILDFSRNYYTSRGNCPCCGEGLNRTFIYCDKCGQKLDWE